VAPVRCRTQPPPEPHGASLSLPPWSRTQATRRPGSAAGRRGNRPARLGAGQQMPCPPLFPIFSLTLSPLSLSHSPQPDPPPAARPAAGGLLRRRPASLAGHGRAAAAAPLLLLLCVLCCVCVCVMLCVCGGVGVCMLLCVCVLLLCPLIGFG